MTLNRQRLSLLFLLGALLAPAVAHADLVSPPPPDCVDRPAGTQCILANGTAGICRHTADSRRPGREFITCEADGHECDRLAVGAECHGYLSRPSHCREFTNPERHDHWRACMNDDVGAPATAPAIAAPPEPVAPTPAPAAIPAPRRVPVSDPPAADPPRPATSHGRCSATPSSSPAAPPPGAYLLGVGIVALVATRSRRSARR